MSAVNHFRKNISYWSLDLGGRCIITASNADRREAFDWIVDKDNTPVSDIFDDSVIDLERRSDFTSSTNLLDYQDTGNPGLSGDHLVLLPPRIYGYAMLTRKWYPLNINCVKDFDPARSQAISKGFEDLVLPPGHKKLLQAVVRNQISNPQQTLGPMKDSLETFSMDVVKSKGKGLIILLHGVPGVGKTSTAECIAEQLKRPLLPITCGDIGTTVKVAEEVLSEYCALAYRWRCVLLLDEADIFLAKRQHGDLHRNALVSGKNHSLGHILSWADSCVVFLRVLEYYSGVIILTTNRVGEFDEAFRSRIHISLYYPKLDYKSTSKVWERNIQRLKQSSLDLVVDEEEIRKFAEKHWKANRERPSRRWNGRQIKNAFQTALALANWDFQETKKGRSQERPILRTEHFERVANVSTHFDDYISSIYSIDVDDQDTYSVLAERNELRKDSHSVTPFGRSRGEVVLPRSSRDVPFRRDFGGRSSRYTERPEGLRDEIEEDEEPDDDDNEDDVEELKLQELKLRRQLAERKQKKTAKEKENQDGSPEEDEDEW